jgi:hypothetical protein
MEGGDVWVEYTVKGEYIIVVDDAGVGNHIVDLAG